MNIDFGHYTNLINVWSGIRAYDWEKTQKLINVQGTIIPDPRLIPHYTLDYYFDQITLCIIFSA